MADFGGRQFLDPLQVIDLVGVQEGSKVGDLGCGSGGFFTIPLAQRVGPTGIIYAVDILPEALKATESNAKSNNLTNVVPVWSNLEIPKGTNIPALSLDIAFLITMLYQNKNREAILLEASRLLRPGGRLVIIDWKPGSTIYGPRRELRIDPEIIRTVAIPLGFEEVSMNEIGEYHFMMVFRKS